MEGLGGVASLEEMCHWGEASKFPKPPPSLCALSCLVLMGQGIKAELLFSACFYAPCYDGHGEMDANPKL